MAENPTPCETRTKNPDAARVDLGILLVHGIGNHKQGETLNEFATPIIKWLDRWLARDVLDERLVGTLGRHTLAKDFEGTAKFTRGTLRQPDLPLDEPAHAHARICVTPEQGKPTEQSWLFAESWWSPQTLMPQVSPFLLWLITRGPWLILLHLSQSFGIDYKAFSAEIQGPDPETDAEKWHRFLKFLKVVAITTVWLAISLLVITLWCIVSLIALVPIGYVRERVYALLLAVTGVVGDSYVLINDPIQRVAFANNARRALAWLEDQGCSKLAVVAHSQGAAVARDVLLESGAPKIDLFVTLGPGIAKLDALSDRERMEPQSFMWSGAAAPLTLIAVLLFLRLLAIEETGIALFGFPVLLAILALVSISRSWNSVSDSLYRLRPGWPLVALNRSYQPKMRWRDFYASHDPVANGSLSTTIAANVTRIVSRKVMVLASLLGDHTAYWTSRADFVPRVVAALDFCAGAGLFASRSAVRRVVRARATYRQWVRFLWASRWIGVAALAMPLFAFDRVRRVASDLHASLQLLPVESIAGAITGMDKAFGWIAGEPSSGEGVTALLLLVALCATALYVWGRIVAYWWQHTSSLLMTLVFTPSHDQWLNRFGHWLLVAWVVTLACLPPALSAAWTFFPELISWQTLFRFLAMFATLACMIGWFGMLLAIVVMTREFAGSLQGAHKANPSWWSAVKRVPDLWVLPGSWLLLGGVGFLLSQNRYAPELWPPAVFIFALGALYWVLRKKAR